MKIKTPIDARDYLIDEIKRTFVGPGEGHFIKDTASFQFDPANIYRHKQEILDESPTQTYLAGILYPQKHPENFNEKIDEDLNSDIEDSVNEISKDITEPQENTNGSDLKSDEDDKESDNQVDNNRDIDLTNEYKQSAIGISVLLKIPENLLIRINNMGVYRNLKNDIPEEIIIISLFLSKYAKDKKSYDWFKSNFSLSKNQRIETLNFLSNVFNIKNTRIKNIEDYFDKYTRCR